MCDLDEACDASADSFAHARKEHQCWACRETIRKKDRYHRSALLYDGHWTVYRHCLRCWSICEALWKAGAGVIDYGLDCGETWEEAERGPLPDSVAVLAFLTPDEAQARLGGGDAAVAS